MRVLAHLDPVVLERELLRRIDAAHARAKLASTLIVTPTARLASHVQYRLCELRGAWLGLEVLHLAAIPRRMLADHGDPSVELLTPLLREALLTRCLGRLTHNLWSRFIDQRPGAARAVLGAMSDMREAGIEPATLAAAARAERERALSEVYTAYCQALDAAQTENWYDESGLVRQALPLAADYASRFGSIFIHGAYELNGIQLDLVRGIDAATEVTALVPLAPGSAVSRYAETHAREHLLAQGAEIELIEAGPDEERPALHTLYDEESRPDPAGSDRFGFRHTQGCEPEVRVALREALCAIETGCPPTEIAIVARDLSVYAGAIEEAFEGQDLPWTSSLSSPLRRQPLVHDFLLLIRVVAEDFPRRATAELLASPRIDWKPLAGEGEPPRGTHADSWSRRARIVGGLTEWTRDLPRWAAQARKYEEQTDEKRAEEEARAQVRANQARRMAGVLKRLAALLLPAESRTWGQHADALLSLLDQPLFREGDDTAGDALERLRGLLEEMRRLESVVHEKRRLPFSEMRSWLDGAVTGSTMTLQAHDGGGLRVLDAMQLRGLTFRRVFLLGMNSGQFPRTPREDPVLPDSLRARLREETGRPLSLKSAGVEEERQLLSMVLGAASERIEISWQRADESGKALTPALALREVARLAHGAPEVERLKQQARHMRSHPAQALHDLLLQPGLLSRNDELLLIALHGSGSETAEALGHRAGALTDGLRMLQATQSFRPVDGAYDARIGPPATGTDALSVTGLETLGMCPLKFFFARVLRVHELDEEASAMEIAPRELGTQIHDLLERLYRKLDDEGLFTGGDPQALYERGLELLAERREAIFGDLGLRLSRHLPVLWRQTARGWFSALKNFVERDLGSIAENGSRPLSFEEFRSDEVDFGAGVGLTVRGRFDRILETESGVLIGDYKTSGNLKRRGDLTKMLRVETLQAPLYSMLSGEGAAMELLGVGPSFESNDVEARVTFSGFENDDQQAGFLESMRVILALWRRGSFPLHEGRHCDWCAYDQACRRKHPPTVDREDAMADAGDYRLVLEKSKTRGTSMAMVAAEQVKSKGPSA